MAPLYEIHALIDPSKEEKLFAGELPAPDESNWKPTLTVTTTGRFPRQPMWTTHRAFDNDEKARAYGKEIAKNTSYVRVKVERLGITRDDPVVAGEDYFESHIKVKPGGDVEALAKACLLFGAQLLVNPRSTLVAPVTTLRRYDITSRAFLALHEALTRKIQSAGHEVHRTHLERGILDTNVTTDEGWLYPEGKTIRETIREATPARLTLAI